MKKVLSLVLAAVMIMTLSSSAIYAAPNKNPNAAFNKNQSAFENKVKNKTMNEGEEEVKNEQLKEQLRFTMLNGEGLPYGIGKRLVLPPGLQMLFERGNLPPGIAKKLMDSYYPLPGNKTDLEVLEALIVTANSKVTTAVEAEFKGGLTTINTFKAAILVAENFVDGYVDTQAAQIKTEIDQLKAAMKVFNDAQFIPEKLVEVKLILVKLNDYKTSYYALLNEEKKEDLNELIAFIETFTRTTDPVQLTIGDFDKIVMLVKAFNDPLISLYNVINEAEILLFKDITNPALGYKETEGTVQGTYLPGSNLALKNAITVAETFVASHTTQSMITIKTQVEAQVNTLNIAIETFKGNRVLGLSEMSVVKMIIDILEDNYNTPYSTRLTTLINDSKFYVANPALFTIAAYDDLLDRTQYYISDLFESLAIELEALLVDAKAEILVAADSVEKTALIALVVEIEAYIDAEEFEYEEMVAYYNELVVAINAL